MRRALLASILVLGAVPSRAQAPADPITVGSIRLEGVEHVDASRLRAVMRTQAPSRLPFSKKPRYSAADAKDDVNRILAFYARHGYRQARVTRVTSDIDQESRTAAVTFMIDEGSPVLAGRVLFEAFPEEAAHDLDRLRRTADYREGAPLEHAWVEQIRDGAVRILREAGHARAAVDVTEQEDADGGTAVVFTARPGAVVRVGEIDVQGLQAVHEDVVLRQLAFASGDAYRESKLDETERALRALELFEFVYVRPRLDAVVDDLVPVRVTVAEARHRRTDLGLGYGTEERARAQASWRNVNLGGTGRTLGLLGRASALEWGVRANIVEPYVFSRHLSLGATGQWWYENEPIYRMRTYGGRGTFTWHTDGRDLARQRGVLTSVGLTFINDYTRYSVSDFALEDPSYRAQLISLGLDPETGEGQGTLVALRLQLQRSSVLNALDARQGTAVTLAAERAGGGIGGDFTYTELVADVRGYRQVGRVVLAARGRVGAISTRDTPGAVPFFKRYFLGGSTSLRGWGRFDVSPLTDSGMPIGGLAVVETSGEARVPVTRSLSLVGFVDAGNVWERARDIDVSDLRVNVGSGIRYATPIGPVRLDFGYQLTPIEGLMVRGRPERRHWRVHFSIGQAF